MDFTNNILALKDTSSVDSINWEDRRLYDINGNISASYTDRVLYDQGGTTAVDWQNRYLFTDASAPVNGYIYWQGTGNVNIDIAKTTTVDFYQNDFNLSSTARQSLMSYIRLNNPTWWSGHTMQYDTDGLSAGTIVSFNGGTWGLTNWGNASASKLLGVVLISATDGLILLDGHCLLTTDKTTYPDMLECPDMSGSDLGTPIYGAQGVTGGTSIAPPTATGQYVRILGHCYDKYSSDSIFLFFFRPSNDWIVV